jgi:uncharacterized protein YbjT (DUF2867 family)
VVTGPQALSFAEAAEDLSAALGTEVRYVDLPLEDARQGMLQGACPGGVRLLDCEPGDEARPRRFVQGLCVAVGSPAESASSAAQTVTARL